MLTIDAIEHLDPRTLTPHPENSRKHSDQQITKLVASIEQFGFNGAITIDEAGTILAGHGRCAAAIRMGLATVPCVRRHGLSVAQKRAYIIADNAIALEAEWDDAMLADQIAQIQDAGLDLDSLGISDIALATIEQPKPIAAKDIAALEQKTDAEPVTQEAFEREMARTDTNGLVPIVPIYAEHHEAFVIVCDNEIDEAWLRNLLGLEKPHQSYKDVKVQRANVTTAAKLRERLQ